ncbi:uncharacterized protein LOC144096909 [Amblyomma americanum]
MNPHADYQLARTLTLLSYISISTGTCPPVLPYMFQPALLVTLIAISVCRVRTFAYCIRVKVIPEDAQALFGALPPSINHANRVCKILRSEWQRQGRLYKDALHAQEKEWCNVEGLHLLNNWKPSSTCVPVRKTVRYLKDNGLCILQSDKEGGFAVLQIDLYRKKAHDAVNSVFERHQPFLVQKIAFYSRWKNLLVKTYSVRAHL